MRAVQTVLTQLRKVKDDATVGIIQTAELTRFQKQSVYRPNAPYALITIRPKTDRRTGEGTTVWATYNLNVALIFSARETDEENAVQAWAEALSRRVMNYLDPVLVDNPNGIDFRQEIGTNGAEIWQWDLSDKRKNTLDRNVMQADGSSKAVTGSRWRYLMELPIKTWPNTPL